MFVSLGKTNLVLRVHGYLQRYGFINFGMINRVNPMHGKEVMMLRIYWLLKPHVLLVPYTFSLTSIQGSPTTDWSSMHVFIVAFVHTGDLLLTQIMGQNLPLL